jgi:AcrR family transcriptional regulator
MDAREKIIETAMRLFSTQGYGNTSLSQVAKEAQVSKALIFWHFENKESLFRTAVQRTFEPYIINVADDLEGLSEIDQIKRLIDEYYDFVSKNIYSVKFFLGLVLREEKHPDDLVAHMTELQRMYRNLLGDIIDNGRQKGELRATVRPSLTRGSSSAPSTASSCRVSSVAPCPRRARSWSISRRRWSTRCGVDCTAHRP